MRFPRDKPPFSERVFAHWLAEFANDQGLPDHRLRRWISTTVILAAVERYETENGTPLALLEGGAAMELRLGLRARASKDVDLVLLVPTDGLEQLRSALAHGWHDFTCHERGATPIHETGTVQIDLQVRYRGDVWQRVKLEVAQAEGALADDVELIKAPIQLSTFGLPAGPARIACLGVSYQIAQKLHACTERFAGRANTRVRDVPDLVLLAEFVDDWAAVRAACADVFDVRAKQAWPPNVEPEPTWAAEYAGVIDELEGFPAMVFDDAFGRVNAIIRRIDEAR